VVEQIKMSKQADPVKAFLTALSLIGGLLAALLVWFLQYASRF
jgi:uncharacterized protein involved in exopolysaccharide biosynthesis